MTNLATDLESKSGGGDCRGLPNRRVRPDRRAGREEEPSIVDGDKVLGRQQDVEAVLQPGSEAAYDALDKDAATLYVVVG